MTERVVTLPKSGGSVTLKDPASLRVKDRRRVIAAANNEERLLQAMSLTDGLIAALVVEWSLDLVIPSIKLSTLDELELADYDFLTEIAQEAAKTIFPKTAKTPEAEADAESPTENSND